MGKRGPQPKSAAAKALAGNPSGRPLPVAGPSAPPLTAVPKPPAWLAPAGKREWLRLGKQLLDMGRLTDVDMTAYLLYCETFATWIEATKALHKEGIIIGEGLTMRRNPWCQVAERAQLLLQNSLKQFGLTPAARSSLMPGNVAPDEDDFTQMMHRKVGPQN